MAQWFRMDDYNLIDLSEAYAMRLPSRGSSSAVFMPDRGRLIPIPSAYKATQAELSRIAEDHNGDWGHLAVNGYYFNMSKLERVIFMHGPASVIRSASLVLRGGIAQFPGVPAIKLSVKDEETL